MRLVRSGRFRNKSYSYTCIIYSYIRFIYTYTRVDSPPLQMRRLYVVHEQTTLPKLVITPKVDLLVILHHSYSAVLSEALVRFNVSQAFTRGQSTMR